MVESLSFLIVNVEPANQTGYLFIHNTFGDYFFSLHFTFLLNSSQDYIMYYMDDLSVKISFLSCESMARLLEKYKITLRERDQNIKGILEEITLRMKRKRRNLCLAVLLSRWKMNANLSSK